MIFASSALILLVATIATAQSSNPSIPEGNCPGAQLVNTTTLQLGDNTIQYTRYYCADNVPVDVSETADSGEATDGDTPKDPVNEEAPSDAPAVNDTTVVPTPDPTQDDPSLSRRGFFDIWPLCLLFHTCKPKHFPPFFPPYHPPKPTKTPPPPPPPPKPRNVCGANCTVTCNNNVGNLPPVSDDCATVQASIQIFADELADTFITESNHLESLTFGTCTIFFENLGKTDVEYCWNDFANVSAIAGGPCFPPAHPPSSEGLCTSKDKSWAVGISHS